MISGLEVLLLLLLGGDGGSDASPRATTASGSAGAMLASAELIVNDVPHGDAFVLLRDGVAWVPVDALRAAGLRIDDGARMPAPRAGGGAGAGVGELVSLASLAPAIGYTWDDREVQLRITAQANQFARQIITLGSAAPGDLIRPRNSSLFVNYAASAQSSGTSVATDAGVSQRGVLLRTGGGRDAFGRVWRAPTHVTIDDTTRLIRWDAGDSVAAGGLVATARPIVGLSVSRELGIDPYFVRYTPLALSGAAMTPSVAEIYVNGQLVRRERIAPGAFTLSGLPPTVGAGDATVILRDAFGREQQLASSFYEPASLLAPGLQEFHYAIGMPRDESQLWRYSGLTAQATHRVGVSDRVTLGAHANYGPGLLTIEPTIAARALIGEIETTVATARVAERIGTAWLTAWSYRGRAWSGGVSARVASRSLQPAAAAAPLSALSAISTTPRSAIDAHAGWTVGRVVTVSAAQTYGRDWQLQRLVRQTVSMMMPLTARLHATATWTRTVSAGVARQEAFAGIILRIGPRSAVTVATRRLDDQQAAHISYQRSLPVGPGYGARVEWNSDARDVDAAGQAQGQYGRVELRHDLFGASASTSLGVAGAIAAVGGHLFATRTIDDAFAVIKVADVPGVRAYASNQFVGRTNSHGEVVVPNVVSYYGNRLSIEPEDVPLTHDIRAQEYAIAPALRAGALVRFEAPPVRPVTGRLLIAGRALAFGDARVGGQVSPLGSRGEFFFERLDPGRHHVLAFVEGREYGCDLTVPDVRDATGRPVDLGEILCTGPLLEAASQQP